MSQVRHLIDAATVAALYERKDELRLLEADITTMYRGRFEEYMEAKSRTMMARLLDRGVDEQAALHAVSVELQKDLAVWKASRPRR
jgi:hypothetical protein